MQSFVYISVISIINLQGEGMATAQTDIHIWVSPVLQGCGFVVGTQLENTVLATGSLQVLLHKVKRLLLETATTWEAGRKTCVCF